MDTLVRDMGSGIYPESGLDPCARGVLLFEFLFMNLFQGFVIWAYAAWPTMKQVVKVWEPQCLAPECLHVIMRSHETVAHLGMRHDVDDK